MLGTLTTVAVRQATLGATVKNKWMSALPIHAKMEPHAPTTLEDIVVSVCLVTMVSTAPKKSMNVSHSPVKMEAPASILSTHTNVPVLEELKVSTVRLIWMTATLPRIH